MRYVVGVDIGGTNIVVGTVSEDGQQVLGFRSTPTQPEEGPQAVIGRIARLTVAGTAVHVETLAEGIKDPTGVDIETMTDHSRMGWYVQAQLSGLFNPDKAPPVQLPFKLTPVERLLVMSDARMMDWLHQQTWLCPSELIAPWWRAAIQKYSHPD